MLCVRNAEKSYWLTHIPHYEHRDIATFSGERCHLCGINQYDWAAMGGTYRPDQVNRYDLEPPVGCWPGYDRHAFDTVDYGLAGGQEVLCVRCGQTP